MKSTSSQRVQMIHRRALAVAMRVAGGDAQHAAKALGITVQELLILLDGDPSSMWSATGPRHAISGTRPKTIPPIEADDQDATRSDDDPDGAAW